MPLSPLKLQAKPNFKYTFRNIALLYEALTHSYGDVWRTLANNVVYRKKTNYRLKTLGVSVLKLLLSEQAFRENETTAGPGKLTQTREKFLEEEVLQSIGRDLELDRFIEVKKGFPLRAIEKQYPDVIKAIIGAVFVDASSSNILGNAGLSVTRSVLSRMYESTNLFTVDWMFQPFDDCFPRTNFKDVSEYLLSRGYAQRNEISNPAILSGRIGHTFETPRYLIEALTHSSCKQFDDLKNVPHFERMEFLGDAVYELIICEYLFWYYVNDPKGTHFSKKELDKYTSEPYQQMLAEHISLSKYLLKPSGVEIKKMHMFFESVIGAIYVDSSVPLASTKGILINLANECSIEFLNFGCAKLPYSITTAYTTKYRLTNQHRFPHTPEDGFSPSPNILDQYTISDVMVFAKNWEFFTASENEHLSLMRVALEIAEDKSEKLFLPLVSANMFEYTRTDVYGVAAQKLLEIMDSPDSHKLTELLAKIRATKSRRARGGTYVSPDGKIAFNESEMFEAFCQTLREIAIPESRPVERVKVSQEQDIHECSRHQKEEEILVEPTEDNELSLDDIESESYHSQSEEEMVIQPREDNGVTLDEAWRAVICLWNFFLRWSCLLGKWAGNQMLTLISLILQLMLYLLLLVVFMEVAFRLRTYCEDVSNRIEMQMVSQ